MTADIINFGCRLNIAEGEAIRAGWPKGDDADDAVIINSCAVTAEAERQARQAIRRAAKSGKRVFATGCAVRLDPGKWSEIAEVLPRRNEPRPAVSGAQHARAFVEVQNGCDHDCTFCITRIARGPSRSLSSDAIVAAIRDVVEKSQREVILTGVDLTSYEGGVAALVARILRDVPDLPRLRLSSLDPAEVDAPLFDLLTNEPRLMPHVHLSLQSGDDMILKRMKRRHNRSQAIDLVARLKSARPEIAIGADLIAGFPTETEAMFANSRAIIDECEIVFGHIFPYSPRPGTAAALMPQVPPAIAKARAAELRAASAARKSAWLVGQVGTDARVLVERSGTSGHAENFAQVSLPPSIAGSLQTVRIAASTGETLIAEPLAAAA
jgi:threonylcarbamoyladenosine tRNA methylthiotransferase MtaB